MIWELRHYDIVPGRIADIHARFGDDLPPLLARYEIDVVGRWTTDAGTDHANFAYLIAYDDLAQREMQWARFYADPQWPVIRARSNGAIDLVRSIEITFLRPALGWNPTASDSPVGGVHELTITQTMNGQPAAVSDALHSTALGLSQHGGNVLLVADLVTGSGLPKCAMLASWDDAVHRRLAREAMAKDPAGQAAIADQIVRFGAPLLRESESLLLAPAADALPRGWLGFKPDQSI